MIASRIARNVTGEEREHFQRYGFVHLTRMLPAAEIERLRAAAALALDTFAVSPSACDLSAVAGSAQRGRAGTSASDDPWPATPFCLSPPGPLLRDAGLRPLADRIAHQGPRGRFLTDSSIWRRIPDLSDFALQDGLPAVAASFVEASSLRFYDDELQIKEPYTPERAAFHQDLSYMHIGGGEGCTLWLPLDPARSGGGTIGYVPGSHKWRQIFRPNLMVSDMPCPGSEGAAMPPVELSPDKFGVQYVDAEPGDILVHHFLTLWGSQGNRTARPLRTFMFRYLDAAIGYAHRPRVPVPPLHRRSAADGEALDRHVHPVAWPSPAAARRSARS